LTHMGPAFNRPTLALFGATCPYRVTSRTNTVVLYHELPCSPCRRSPTCNGEYSCMQLITEEEVLASVDQILEASEQVA
jgi:heptosyltransferase-1